MTHKQASLLTPGTLLLGPGKIHAITTGRIKYTDRTGYRIPIRIGVRPTYLTHNTSYAWSIEKVDK